MKLRILFIIVLAIPLPQSRVAAQEAKGWHAGIAKAIITPKRPMWMSGYAARDKPADGKVHDLWAKALVLQDGKGKRGVLVTLDLVGIDRDFSDQVCADLQKQYGFERDAINLSSSHTHSGPVVGRNLITMYPLDDLQLGLVKTYTRELHQQLVDLVGAAVQTLKPANLSWGNGFATFATNRRNNKEAEVPKLRQLGQLKGPVDHEVPVLAVRNPDGKVRAVVFGYACHATVLSFYQWCGDYAGFAQLELESRYPDATALFVAGCGGDQNPVPRRSVELAHAYGKQLADAVVAVLDAPMTSVQASFKAAYTLVKLPFGQLPSREKIVQDTMSKDANIASRARKLLNDLEKSGSLHETYPYPVQAWQLGNDLTWVALGGEVVVDYPIRLKKELGKIWVTAYANDVMGYIPSLRVLKEGGYEGDTSMIYYGLPCAWGPRIEELIVAAVHEQVSKLRAQKGAGDSSNRGLVIDAGGK